MLLVFQRTVPMWRQTGSNCHTSFGPYPSHPSWGRVTESCSVIELHGVRYIHKLCLCCWSLCCRCGPCRPHRTRWPWGGQAGSWSCWWKAGARDPRHPYFVDPLLEVGAMLPRANTIALRMAEREVGRSHGHRVCPGGTARTANRGSRNKGFIRTNAAVSKTS